MENLKIRPIQNKKELKEAFKIRKKVFQKEQNVSKDIDFDGLDKGADHIIAFYKGKPVGCCRIRFINKKAKWERFAVLKKYRGKGIGKNVTKFVIRYCKEKNVKKLYFHAQYYLKDFYKKQGFKTKGKPFMEANIKHIEMYMEF